METKGQDGYRRIGDSFSSHRGFVTVLMLVSCWSLYLSFHHAAGRFHVPHHFVTSFTVFGWWGVVLDLFFYLWVSCLGLWFIKTSNDWASRVMFIGFIGPLIINPLKMIMPGYVSPIWWIELLMTLLCLLASIAVLQKRSKMPSAPE